MRDPGRRRPRLVDVATEAGVSTATASLVLRHRPGPSASARAAVQAAADRLGYRPDRTASVLARRRSHLLGVLFDVTSPFHAELVHALDVAAGRRGLDLVLATATARRDEAGAIDLLLDFRCEGLLLLGPTLRTPAVEAVGARCPTVVVGRAGRGPVPGVLADDGVGLELAVDHLVDLGHRRIAYVDGPPGSIATARRRGYRAAMRRHGLAGLDIVAGGLTEEAGARAATVLLGRPGPARPTAVIGFNDRCAVGVRDVMLRRGLSVPGGVSVVGYDDSPQARGGTVDLTTISQDPAGLAEATVEVMTRLLDGATPEDPSPSPGTPSGRGRMRDVVIDPRLVVRGSTGPLTA